jgi:hypothetical protein
MARVVMEQTFEEPLSDEEQARFAKRLDECLEMRNGAWARSYLATDRRRMICEFEAPDAESVRQALRSSGLSFDRVWAADVYAVEDYPEHLAKLNALRKSAGTG